MQKIETLFKRDPENPKLVTRSLAQVALLGVERWVPTWKIDGSACLVRDGVPYRRHALKKGKAKPPGWIHWSFDPEHGSGHGWAPVSQMNTGDQYHCEAAESFRPERMLDWTYELVGPKVQDNPYGLDSHELWRHGQVIPATIHVQYDEVRRFLESNPCEGIVWWLEARPVAKIKRRDFGFAWPLPSDERHRARGLVTL